MSERIIKVVVIGPESTGKSMLCEKLAAHYNTIWVEEYAREFLLKNGNAYTQEDLLTIAKGQIKNEEKVLIKRRCCFICKGIKHYIININFNTDISPL